MQHSESTRAAPNMILLCSKADCKLCMSVGFLQKLQTYDKDNIPPEVISKIRPYMDNPDFEPEVVKKASKAAFGLVSWVRAMEAYDRYMPACTLCSSWVLTLMLSALTPEQLNHACCVTPRQPYAEQQHGRNHKAMKTRIGVNCVHIPSLWI